MSHDIDETSDKPAMADFGKRSWHRLGEKAWQSALALLGSLTIEEKN